MKTWKWVVLSLLFVLAPQAYPQTPPTISVQLSNSYARLSFTGDVGSGCTIQSVTNLAKNWQFVTNFTLLTNQSLVVDPTGPVAVQRFYRIYAQQVPTNIVATNMVWLSPGTFTMGSPDSEAERNSDEGPQTRVTVSHGFWMGRFPVTQGEYASVVGNNPSYFNGDRSGFPYHDRNYGTDLSRPVEHVGSYDAAAYCAALTMAERNAGRLAAGYVYRLPTEAEWEYACRAGTTTAFHYGPTLRSGMANFDGYDEYDASIGTIYNPSGIYLASTTSVGSYAPNAWGLYDMHGNVSQWCQDWYGGPYSGVDQTDPRGPASGSVRVIRGGIYYFNAWYCRSANRYGTDPGTRGSGIGFRVVLAQAQP